MQNTDNSYWNEEDDSDIICPYCGMSYSPSYEETYISGEAVNCYTEDEQTFTCEKCGKKFTMYGYQTGWNYHTETIDGQMTEDEHEEEVWELEEWLKAYAK